MAPILEELLHSDVPLKHVFDWLLTDQVAEELGIFLNNHNHTSLSRTFPPLLVAFIKDQTTRILKENHVSPHEIIALSPKVQVSSPTANEILLSPTNVKSVETRKIRKKFDHSIDLQNEQAFPPLQNTSPQASNSQRKRRINPTQLSSVPGNNVSPSRFGNTFTRSIPGSPPVSGNPFNLAKEQTQHKSFDHERELLKQHRKQLPGQVSRSEKPPSTPTVESDVGSSSTSIRWACIEPEIDLVTETLALDRLSSLYSFCLSRSLIPAFFSEVKFLLELVLLQVSPLRHQPNPSLLLNSVHHCVYFSAHTLTHLDGWWDYVDRSTLQLLTENPRLMKFCPELICRMLDHLSSLASSRRRSLTILQPTVGNVAFQSDTDNRFNFASDNSFHTFRKQRDQFCEVWSIWKQNCCSTEWNMALALQKKIQSLVDLKRDCVNYVHLARLFRSQLLNVARLVDDVEESSGPLGLLQSSDPVKLRRLRERLVNPPEARGGKESIVFEGDQEFFRDFIILASSTAFNEHLKNCLINGIEDLSRNALTHSGHEDCDADGRGSQFTESVISLRVLAKFLAFLTFQPHELVDHPPEHIFHKLSQLRVRDKMSIDLLFYVDLAFQRQRLVLILPWIVTFLSMADAVSLCLPSCHPILCYLVWIFKKMTSTSPPPLHAASTFFIRILLSWLFDLNPFPRSLLAKNLPELWSEIEVHLEQPKSEERVTSLSDTSLDQWPLVESRLLYQCCPFLWSWKTLLTDFVADMKCRTGERGATSSGHRKITPVSAEDPTQGIRRTQQPEAGKSLQLLLEENFFHNQPSSVKRTVDFVSDRLASNVVRDVRQRVIPSAACQGQETVKLWTSNSSLVDGQRIDEQLDLLSGQLCQNVRDQMSKSLATVTALSALDATLVVLLPGDLLPQVRQVCVSVTVRLTREKVLEWTDRHVTLALFKNDLATEWSKRDTFSGQRNAAMTTLGPQTTAAIPIPTPAELANHDDSTWSPSMLLDHFKKLIRETVRDADKMTSDDVLSALIRTQACLERRCDITPIVFKCLIQLSYDFLFITCVFQPEIVGTAAITSYVDFWRRFYQPDKWVSGQQPQQATEAEETLNAQARPLANLWLIFAPKQLLLLAQSTSPRLSWSQVTSLVLHLLKNRLMRYKEVEEQAIAVVRQTWPQELLQRFATCLQDIVDWQRSQMSSNSSVDDLDGNIDAELLSWLSWFCSQTDLL